MRQTIPRSGEGFSASLRCHPRAECGKRRFSDNLMARSEGAQHPQDGMRHVMNPANEGHEAFPPDRRGCTLNPVGFTAGAIHRRNEKPCAAHGERQVFTWAFLRDRKDALWTSKPQHGRGSGPSGVAFHDIDRPAQGKDPGQRRMFGRVKHQALTHTWRKPPAEMTRGASP
jgi:hypothetical protein